MNAPSVFSRLLLIFGALAVVGLTYWFLATSLAPVTLPVNPPARGSVHFDPSVDVTKKPYFSDMHLLGPESVTPENLGRPDPFTPVIRASTSTAVTSTGSVTTSSEISAPTTTEVVPTTETTTTTPETQAITPAPVIQTGL